MDENSDPVAGRDKAGMWAPGSPKRKWAALGLLAAFSLLAVKTMDPGRVRSAVLVLLVFFAVRIVLAGYASR